MPASREVFSWPEARMYLGPDAGLVEIAYIESLSISLDFEWDIRKSMASASWHARTTQTLKDQRVNVSIGRMWDGGAFYAQAKSATAFNFSISAGGAADGNTASFAIWSAVFNTFSFEGRDGELFRCKASMMAPDISGL